MRKMMQSSEIKIVSNTVRLNYPVVVRIKSILPIVDEFIVKLGPDADETFGSIQLASQEKGTIIWEK